MKMYDILRRPMITEKTMALVEAGKYTFECNPKANKIEIKNAVEKMFNVKVVSVNTINYDGKTKRLGKYVGKTNAFKKAIVEIEKGQSIEIFNI